MADPTVVKIGGGLLRGGSVTAVLEACREVAAMPGPVLVVPGGGPFAEAVRAADVQVGLPEPVTHAMALVAMDQFGTILGELLPAATRMRELTRPTGLALLVAAAAFEGRPEVPQSWDVTSDSLAVLAAAAIGAREAILIKRALGILWKWPGDGPPIPSLTADELTDLQAAGGGRAVDPYLAEAVRSTGVPVTVRAPGGTGTRIAR